MRTASAEPSGEIWRWSAVEVAGAIDRGQISSVEAVRSCLGRIAVANPEINAVVSVLADQATATAEKRDRARWEGEVLGPLNGAPVTVKVNVDLPRSHQRCVLHCTRRGGGWRKRATWWSAPRRQACGRHS